MATFGSINIGIALAATIISIVCLLLLSNKTIKQSRGTKEQLQQARAADKLQIIALALVLLAALALTACCAILVIAFFSGDNSITYVVKNRSNSVSDFAVLFKLSGLWAGREGSLLFWTWLISVFNAVVATRSWLSTNKALKLPKEATKKRTNLDFLRTKALDTSALAVAQIVLFIFILILVFDENNRPFIPLAAQYLDAHGNLTGNAALWSMNALLEHWAMAIHPPTLFVGYAGMTIPFAYAIASLIVNDPSKAWVERAHRYTLVSWLFLGAGIGLGAVWAYVVLGWGGYWGWDAVENASLLSWGAAVALIHSMTIYKQRGTLKRWAVMLACLTFAFIIVGTFITRSGIVDSVHAFEANQFSLILFGILIFVPLIIGAVGLFLRRKTFKDATDESTEAESIMSKDVAYYLNNVIMVVCMLFLMYMTLSSALPEFLPFGGQALKAGAYNAIARPIGVLYCFVLAACPLLAWKKTTVANFLKQAWLPAIGAAAALVLLGIYFATTLLPTYMQIMAQGGNNAQELAQAGPFFYYIGLTIVGFLAASLLFFNALVMLVRALAKRNLRTQTIGGFLAHMSIGILLVGLIGSSMYTYERQGYLANAEYGGYAHSATDSQTADTLEVKGYSLSFVSRDVSIAPNHDDIFYTLTLAVHKDGVFIGEVSPSVQVVQTTGQQMQHAAVISSPTEDLFVSYHGDTDMGDYSLDVRVNPLISLVWIGFALLMLGTAIASFGKRTKKKKPKT